MPPQYSGLGAKHYGKCGLLHAGRQRSGKGVFTVGKNVITETERLILRQMDLSDFKEIAEMLQDIRVMYAWEYAFSDEEVREWIGRMCSRYEKYGYAYWIAQDKKSGAVVGQIGLLPGEVHGTPQMEVGYILKHDCRGRGYALEGARGCVDYAFRHWGVPSVIAEIRPENKASLAVAEKLGFSLRDEIVKIVRGKEMRHLVYAGDTPLVKVVPARESWAAQFESLKRRVGEALGEIGFRIEHVGSTSVPGLAAKPIIDADVVLKDWSSFPETAKRLEQAGWHHRGDLGIPGREAFAASMRLNFAHHLYVCREGITALDNHLKLRDYLRSHPDAVERYGALKMKLASLYPESVLHYCVAKSDLIADMLGAAGLDPEELRKIKEVNSLEHQEVFGAPSGSLGKH